MANFRKAALDVLGIHCVVHSAQLVTKNVNGGPHKAASSGLVTGFRAARWAVSSRGKNSSNVLNVEGRWLSEGNCLKVCFPFDAVVHISIQTLRK